MQDPTVTTTYARIELVGVAEQEVGEAVRNAVRRAARTLQGLEWFEVRQVRGTVVGGEVGRFQVALAVGFRVLHPDELLLASIGESGEAVAGAGAETSMPPPAGVEVEDEALPPDAQP